ncbi:MAG: hypothetical protein QOJ82_1743 [Solirubrobacteraceae bacterium]|nr:hypothetical protein [Solirubrobacteraceae bacterium]
MRHLVVVGASLAGLRAAEAARAAGFDGELTLVGAEPHPPYNRPPLSKQLLAGTMDPAATALRHGLQATWRLGVAAVGLDASRRLVRLSDGDELAYDAIVVATGSAARPWPAPLPELRGLHALRDLDDALALRAAAAPARHVVIVGAGFIGCEVAATLRASGKDVTLVDVAAHPMLPLGPQLGEIWADKHRASGVELRLETGVAEFEGSDGELTAVRLDDGDVLEADLGLIAVGAVPCSGWLAGSGVTLEPGVVCDSTCAAVGVDAVFAAGDVARWPHPLADEALVRVEHWSNAAEMGEVAGHNAVVPAAARRVHAAVPTFWSDQYDWKIQSVGFPHLAERFDIAEGDPAEGRLFAIGERAGRPVAAVGVNAARRMIEFEMSLEAPVA